MDLPGIESHGSDWLLPLVPGKRTPKCSWGTQWEIWCRCGGFKVFFYFHPENWGRFPNLTNIFQRGWNHQPDVIIVDVCSLFEYIWYIRSVGVLEKKWVGSCSVVLVSQQRPGSILAFAPLQHVWNWNIWFGRGFEHWTHQITQSHHYDANGWSPREC